MKIDKNNFLVTGAASGFGLETAKRLINHGAKVIMSDISGDIETIASTLGANAIAHQGEVTSEQDMQAAVQLARGAGGLHGVVHCAGILGGSPILDAHRKPCEMKDFERVVRVNLFGTFNVLRLASAEMTVNDPCGTDGERGVIVLVSSITASDGGPGQCAYGSSKAGVASLVLPAAAELGQYGVRVMGIAPGPASTPMLGNRPPEMLNSLIAKTPFPHRLVEANDFAQLAEHIISNVMLNGEMIRMDGAIRLT